MSSKSRHFASSRRPLPLRELRILAARDGWLDAAADADD
jgi:hypothetical protein